MNEKEDMIKSCCNSKEKTVTKIKRKRDILTEFSSAQDQFLGASSKNESRVTASNGEEKLWSKEGRKYEIDTSIDRLIDREIEREREMKIYLLHVFIYNAKSE